MTDVLKKHEHHVLITDKHLQKAVKKMRKRLAKDHVPTYIDSIIFVALMGSAGKAAQDLLIGTSDVGFVDQMVSQFNRSYLECKRQLADARAEAGLENVH